MTGLPNWHVAALVITIWIFARALHGAKAAGSCPARRRAPLHLKFPSWKARALAFLPRPPVVPLAAAVQSSEDANRAVDAARVPPCSAGMDSCGERRPQTGNLPSQRLLSTTGATPDLRFFKSLI
ncbi:hypothetical protein L209DRAFT_751795, partial [Thermothelomyces heterothallicus CBS 203.75]